MHNYRRWYYENIWTFSKKTNDWAVGTWKGESSNKESTEDRRQAGPNDFCINFKLKYDFLGSKLVGRGRIIPNGRTAYNEHHKDIIIEVKKILEEGVMFAYYPALDKYGFVGTGICRRQESGSFVGETIGYLSGVEDNKIVSANIKIWKGK